MSPKLWCAISASSILLFIFLWKSPLFLPRRRSEFFKPKKTSDLPAYRQTDLKVDAILEKISKHGLHSLTLEEQALMQSTAKKYERRATSKKPESELLF